MQRSTRGLHRILAMFVAAAPILGCTPATRKAEVVHADIGSLDWTRRGGGRMDADERTTFVLRGLRHLLRASLRRPSARKAEKVDLAALAPPATPMVQEAIRIVQASSDPAMVQHCYRTAYWTLVVMQREGPPLTPQAIEEAWVAALLHDVGMDLRPSYGEFTLGGVRVVADLAARFAWDPASAQRASEAITLNPNSHVDRARYGLLAWAMNVGGFAETSRGPYRGMMHPDNLRELETMHPRDGFHAAAPRIVAAELERFPNQRFAMLKKLGFVRRRLRDQPRGGR